MPNASEMSERHAKALARLAELSMALAEDLQARALAAETPDEAAKLAGAFQKVARGVRQTMALEARLAREQARDEREAAIEEARTRPARMMERKALVRRQVERLIWTEAEDGTDGRIGVRILGNVMDEFATGADFLDTPIEVQIQRLKDMIFGYLNRRYEDDDEADEEDGPPDGEAEAPPLRNTG